MYGNGEAGLTLRDVFVKGTVLDIHYMMNYVQKFSYEWNVYQNAELDIPTNSLTTSSSATTSEKIGVYRIGRVYQHLQCPPVRQFQDAEAGTRLRYQVRL